MPADVGRTRSPERDTPERDTPERDTPATDDVRPRHADGRLTQLLNEISDAELDQLSRMLASDEGLLECYPGPSLADECLAILTSDPRTVNRLVRLRHLRIEAEREELDFRHHLLERDALLREADDRSHDP
ncbi:MAG: hypothetical protein ACF788_08000 [Novipirellula sp. JB048]